MSKASDAANGLMVAVSQVAGLYFVPAFRMQSRALPVVGKGGRSRPMFFGEWTDDLGEKHKSGMADWLLMPHIRASIKATITPPFAGVIAPPVLTSSVVGVTIPLWCECKTGRGKLTDDQFAFKLFVENAGAHHIALHDSADELIEWFVTHGVQHP
jgi:hypothetical protein